MNVNEKTLKVLDKVLGKKMSRFHLISEQLCLEVSSQNWCWMPEGLGSHLSLARKGLWAIPAIKPKVVTHVYL